MPIPWNADPPGSARRLAANLRGVALDIKHDAPARRPATATMAQDWHRRAFAGITLPVPYYAGEFRDTDAALPELIGYEVEVGGVLGVLVGGGVVVVVGWGTCATVRTIWVPMSTVSPVWVWDSTVPSGLSLTAK